MFHWFGRDQLQRARVASALTFALWGAGPILWNPAVSMAGDEIIYTLFSDDAGNPQTAEMPVSSSAQSQANSEKARNPVGNSVVDPDTVDIYSSDTILDGDAPLDQPDRAVSPSRIFSPQYYQNVESPDPNSLDHWTSQQAQRSFFEQPWLFERPEWSPGWWADASVSIIKPHVDSSLSSGTLFAATFQARPVQLPFAPLRWTAAPAIRVGYRPTVGRVGFAVGYRGLTSDGSATIPGFDAAGAGQLYSRINVQVLDVDAVFVDTLERLPARLPSLLEWTFGVRTVGSQFVSSASGLQILSARQSNQFVGSGLHAAVRFEWPCGGSAWSLMGRADFAGLVGQNRQDFSQIAIGPPAISDAGSALGITGVTVINAQFGVSYVPVYFERRLKVTAGFEFERWYSIGTTNSNMGFQFQGITLHSYWSF